MRPRMPIQAGMAQVQARQQFPAGRAAKLERGVGVRVGMAG